MGILVLTTPIPSAAYVDAVREFAGEIPVWTEHDTPVPEEVEAILAWRMPRGVLPRYPNLRVLSSIGAGVDALLTTPDLPPEVVVTRVVDPAQAVEIAQFVVAGALHFTRDLATYVAQQARGQWRRLPVRPMSHCRVGVMGLGRVGQAIAKAFLPLGYPVAGWSRSPQAVDGVEVFSGPEGLARFVGQTDILVCALPLTAQTRGMLNRALLAKLPAGAMVVNVGRGEHLVEADLRALLDGGHVAAAVLDVFEQEPVPADNWVWSHPKVLATPHIASSPGKRFVAEQCVDALRRARLGLPQPQAVDRSAGY
jgi:phosphoglycerate dehydrogenase-like enzyme